MSRWRRSIAILGVAGLSWFAATATAGIEPTGLDQTVTTAHFVVHYASATVSSAQAKQVGTDAERAYSLYVGQWGYPPPVDDGDGHTSR
jgi:hypothetical protein